MKKEIVCLWVWLLVMAWCAPVYAKAHAENMSGAEALALLQKNNAVYVQQGAQNQGTQSQGTQSQGKAGDISPERRHTTAAMGQKPYALILTCADSRVPPEHIFMAGIGDIFVVRNAGNVLSGPALASVEYAVSHLGIKLVLVLGHTQCGAIQAALNFDQAESQSASPLQHLVKELNSSVQSAEHDARAAEKLHVHAVVKGLQGHQYLGKLLAENQVLVHGALYTLDSGVVQVLTESK